MTESSEDVRLQKYLANKGVGSRRKCEEYITKGFVKVNGKVVTTLGTKVNPSKDKVSFQSKKINNEKMTRKTIVMYKPRGYVCSKSRIEGRSVYDLIPGNMQDLSTVGRLDKKSEGLLLLSNDGDLTFQLTHPKFEKDKIYHVVVSGDFNDETLKKLNKSFKIEGYRTKPANVDILRASEVKGRVVLRFILQEGRNHQIRHMCEQCVLKVHRLVRVQVEGLQLEGLKPGKWKILSQRDRKDLLSSLKQDV